MSRLHPSTSEAKHLSHPRSSPCDKFILPHKAAPVKRN
nr:MAG TPA: hypothetical protein [Bacteriophage sp.]